MSLTVQWIKCDDGKCWCPFETVNLDGVTANGVYVIWHQGNPARVVYIGQGDVADRIAAHRLNPEVANYSANGTMRVTWAAVASAHQDGVERYLADRYPPLVGVAHPNVEPIAVNGPWD